MPFPQQLIDGYRAFLVSRLRHEQDRYRALSESGQAPQIMVIGCCDSRVSPEVVFDARPGELFVARNIANLVPPYTPDGAQRAVSAALEFAVQALKVKHIVVLGHAQCGGIRALLEGSPMAGRGDDFVGVWMSIAERARRRTLSLAVADEDRRHFCELESVKVSLENLLTFPWIRERVEAQRLTLHGWYFDLADGHLLRLDPSTNEFARIED